MYSVEWIPANDEYNCWNQWTLTRFKWKARLIRWDFVHTIARRERKHYKTRIREV